MKQQLLKTWLMIVCLLAGVGSAWAADWTRCTAVSDLTSGGTFIIGYEATANSGKIIPMKNTDGTATTTAAGYMASGSEIDMLTVTTTADYEVSIEASTAVEDAICIKVGDNYLGNADTKNNCKLFAEQSKYTAFGVTVGTNDVFTLKIAANSSYHTLQYNTSSPRFAVYGGAQKNLVIYKKSGGTVAVKYNVNIASSIQNGSVSASSTTAAEGATVTLTATPDAGYKLSAWDVKDASSNAVEVKDNKFTMPASDVTVSATFEEKGALIYATLADLVADGAPTTTGEEVTVTLTNEEITKIYTSGQYRNGIYMMAGDKEIEIYCKNVPEEWEVGGKVSGTLTCDWKLYNTTWELCPSSWDDLTYTPAPAHVTFNLTVDETKEASETVLAWSSDYISMKAEKSTSSTATNNYYPGTTGKTYTSTRFYTNSTLTITPAEGYAITYVSCEATSETYAKDFSGSTWTNATAKADGTNVTITPTDGTKAISAVIAKTTGFKSITVYYEEAEAPAGKSIAFNATNNGTAYWATFSSSDNIVLSGSIEDWDNDIYSEIAVYAITSVVDGQLNGEPLLDLFDEVEYKWYLPKNTGYLIVSSGIGVEAGHSYPYEIGDDLTFNGIYTDVLASNMLVPSSVAMTNPDNLYYKLTTRNGSNVGFYWGAEDGAPFTMKNQNAAYLAVPKANAVKGFSLSDFETVINRIENAPRANAPIYNLAGQRVNANAKGILIQNGKKFFVK